MKINLLQKIFNEKKILQKMSQMALTYVDRQKERDIILLVEKFL